MCTYKNVGKTCICELCGYNRITCMANESQLSQQQLVLHTPSCSSTTATTHTTTAHTNSNTHTTNTHSNKDKVRKNAYTMLLHDSTKGNNNKKGNNSNNKNNSVTAVKPNTRLSKNKGKK